MGLQENYIFDATCLNYLARTSNLCIIQDHIGSCFLAKEVTEEITKGINDYPELEPHLSQVIGASWLQELTMTDINDLQLYTNLLQRWGRVDRNKGEAATIVLARRHGMVAVLDDRIARKAAIDLGIKFTATIALLAKLVVVGLITLDTAWQIHDDMVALPTSPFWSPIRDRAHFEQVVRDIT